jgi:serine/threonine protein kinase
MSTSYSFDGRFIMVDDFDETKDGDDLPPPPSSGGTTPGSPIGSASMFAGYEVEREIGRGGMGVVYKAVHRRLQRPVALKLILSGVFAHQWERERFLNEARTTAQLEHPNIVQIHDVGEFGSTPFMALEYVEGGTLADQIARRPLTERKAAEVVESLARTAAFAHSKGVIHRDLKPANIFMSLAGPKLGDFGVAKLLESATNVEGTMTGTPSYMSPEQADGRPATPLVDVYALGAVLYECLTGRPPFKAASVGETIKQVLETIPVEPRTLQPSLSRDLDTICMKCLEKDPARRYDSAAALADDLRRFLNREPIVARSITKAERVVRWIKAHPRDSMLIGSALGALLFGSLGIFLQYRETKRQFTRAEGLYTTSEQRRIDAENAQGVAETRRKELEKAIGNMVYLVGVIDLDQLFNLRVLQVDPELLRPALEANKQFLEDHRDDPEREPEIVAAMHRVTLLTRMVGKRAEALELGLKAVARQEKFVQANPEVAQYKRDLAAGHHNVGFLLHGANRSEEAMFHLKKARKIREEFVEAQPENLDYRSELAGCLNDIGLSWIASDEMKPDHASVASAEQALAAARDHQRKVVHNAGHVPRYRALLANHLFNLGRLQAKIGRGQEAKDAADEMLDLMPFDHEIKIRAARILALAAASGGEKGKEFAEAAVAQLKNAFEKPPNSPPMLVYEEYKSILQREDVKALRRRFEGKQ